jgi:hypothetical protein
MAPPFSKELNPMPALKPISREYRIYLALWRKAYLQSETVIVKAPNLSMAVAMRQGMYRAMRPYRNGELEDSELSKSADKYVVYLRKPRDQDKNKEHFLEFRERKALAILEESLDLLGIDEEDLLLGEEKKISIDLTHFLAKESKSEPERKTTFYKRDK